METFNTPYPCRRSSQRPWRRRRYLRVPLPCGRLSCAAAVRYLGGIARDGRAGNASAGVGLVGGVPGKCGRAGGSCGAGAVQDMLLHATLQEIVLRVVVVREVLTARWDVCTRAVATREMIMSADRGAGGVHTRHQGLCTLMLPWFCCTPSCVAYATRRAAQRRGVLTVHLHCRRCQQVVRLSTFVRVGTHHGA